MKQSNIAHDFSNSCHFMKKYITIKLQDMRIIIKLSIQNEPETVLHSLLPELSLKQRKRIHFNIQIRVEYGWSESQFEL